MRVLFIEDDSMKKKLLSRILEDASIRVAELRFAENVEGALSLIKDSNAERKPPFNIVFIDKNLVNPQSAERYAGARKAIDAVAEASPRSHVCIESAERGPGQLGNLPFISLLGDILEEVPEKFRNFFETVEREPFRTEALRANLNALQRPLAVRNKDGRIEVFYFVEGDPFPEKAQAMLRQGGQMLSINDALRLGEETLSAKDRSALMAAREHQTGKHENRPNPGPAQRGAGRPPSGMPHKDTFHRLPQRRHALR